MAQWIWKSQKGQRYNEKYCGYGKAHWEAVFEQFEHIVLMQMQIVMEDTVKVGEGTFFN